MEVVRETGESCPAPRGGLLALDPFPRLGDPRLEQITVLHLLRHEGGRDRELAPDWAFREIEIAEAMNSW